MVKYLIPYDLLALVIAGFTLKMVTQWQILNFWTAWKPMNIFFLVFARKVMLHMPSYVVCRGQLPIWSRYSSSCNFVNMVRTVLHPEALLYLSLN